MDRSSVLDLITSRYAARHGASPTVTYTDLRGESCGGRVCAALGYRRAEREALFLETYLDAPVEQVLADQFQRPVTRADVVEIGNLASCNANAMGTLWARTANDLGHDAEIAVAVLTAPLRKMFSRLGVSQADLPIPADPSLPVVPIVKAHLGAEIGGVLGSGIYRIGTRLSFIGAARLSPDPALNRRIDERTTVNLDASYQWSDWSVALRIDNVLNSRADTFGYISPFSIATTRQFTQQKKPRSAGVTLSKRW